MTPPPACVCADALSNPDHAPLGAILHVRATSARRRPMSSTVIQERWKVRHATFRIRRSDLAATDGWAEANGCTRAEAIRRLTKLGLLAGKED